MNIRTIALLLSCFLGWASGAPPIPEPDFHQACGARAGEVTDRSAIIWTRLTLGPARNRSGLPSRGGSRENMYIPAGTKAADLEGEVPGMPGRVRLRYGAEGSSQAVTTPWFQVGPEADFTHRFDISGLQPGTRYWFVSETGSPDGRETHAPLRGSFRTRPAEDRPQDVIFTVVTGLMYRDLDHAEGFLAFDSMRALRPDFIVMTGDNVYYDTDFPRANSPELARYHWHRMFSFPKHIAFFLEVPGYWEKDDHDIYYDDCWPGMRNPAMDPLTFERGQRIFLEQAPAPRVPYRTFRWGKDLQIWLTEGRDFRTPNDAPDGPAKSIWGERQRRWLMGSLKASGARWKILVSPTPIVGPDRTNKGDNHANRAFAWEGNLFRQWVQKNLPEGFFVACGDRHWQYHSVHPETKVQEFSCGPASDAHAGGSPGHNPDYHRFHRVKGGFLAVQLKEGKLHFRLHGVDGAVGYAWTAP